MMAGSILRAPTARWSRYSGNDPADPASLPSNTVYALEVDGEGRVWVATDGGGLARVVGIRASPDRIRFKVMSREEGLSSDTIYGLLSDSKGGSG